MNFAFLRVAWTASGGLLLLLALLLRVYHLDVQSLWGDEAYSMGVVSGSLDRIWTGALPPDHVPGYFIILWFVTRLFGNSEVILRLPSAVAGAVAVLGVWAVGSQLKLKTAAVLAAALMAVSPLEVFWSQQAKPEALSVAIAVWSTFLLFVAWRRGGIRWWAAYTLLNVIGLYVFYFHVFLLAAHGLVVVAWHCRRREWLPAIRYLAWQALVCATLAPWLLLALSRNLVGEVEFRTTLSLGEYARQSAYGLFAGQPFGGPLGSAMLLLLATLIVVGATLVRGNLFSFETSVIGAWLLVPLAGVYLAQLIVPVYETRYLLFIVPAFTLVLGMSVRELLNKGRLSRLAGVLSLCVIVVFWLRMDTQFYEAPLYAHGFREAASYFARNREDSGMILGLRAESERYAYDYYLHQPGHYQPTSGPIIREQLATLKNSGYKGVWFTAYSGTQQVDIKAALETVAAPTELGTEYHSVWLRYYRFFGGPPSASVASDR